MGARDKLRGMRQGIVRSVTAFLLTVGLFVLYFTCLALTAALMALGSLWRVFRERKRRDSYWGPAAGYAADLDDARRQS